MRVDSDGKGRERLRALVTAFVLNWVSRSLGRDDKTSSKGNDTSRVGHRVVSEDEGHTAGIVGRACCGQEVNLSHDIGDARVLAYREADPIGQVQLRGVSSPAVEDIGSEWCFILNE